MQLMPAVSVRPAGVADERLLAECFRAGRPELAGLPVSLAGMQRQAQWRQYQADFPGNRQYVLESDQPVGTYWFWSGEHEHRLLDVCVLDAFRRRGVGRWLLTELGRSAGAAGRALRLSVWAGNAGALRLYRGCGFEVQGEQHGYLLMQLPPAPGR